MFTRHQSLAASFVRHSRVDSFRRLASALFLLISWAAVLACPPCAQAQATATLTTLYNFSGGSNGANSEAGLVQGSDGNFYGTTFFGGVNGDGTVFRITSAGALTTLYSFSGSSDGNGPEGTLVQGSDGNFYGTNEEGGTKGDGTVFQITPAGVLTILYSFSGSDGDNPNGALIQGSDGNFYGTTTDGGANRVGTVFQITPAGVLTTLHSFSGSDGAYPECALIQGSDGNFYGTTGYGGANGNNGTVFQITPAGALTSLYSFSGSRDGGLPEAALIQSSDGNFYGTTFGEGANGDGTVFRITPAGALTTLYSFSGSDGNGPEGTLVRGSDGNFYGTTQAGGANRAGTVFQITPAGALTSLYSFSGGSDGESLYAGLVQGSGGNFYGTTYYGGVNGAGTVFQLAVAGVTAAPGSVQFTAASANVTEAAGSVTLSVSRSGGGNSAISVNYATADDTAVAGTDYQPASGTLSWANGDTTDKTITVPIINRGLTTGSTFFLVNLSLPAGGAALASPTQAAVMILDTAPTADLQSVTLLSPPAGVTLTVNQPVVLQADVEALSGTLADVEFLAIDGSGNSTDLGDTTDPRGQATWTPAATGTYTLQVVATDTNGATMLAASPVTVAAAAATVPQTNLQAGLDGITVPLNTAVPVVAQAMDSAGNALQNVQFYLDGVPIASSPVTDAITFHPQRAGAAKVEQGPGGRASLVYQSEVMAGKSRQTVTVVGTTASGVSSVSTAATIYGKVNAGTPPTAAIINLASGASVPAGTAGQSVSVAVTGGSRAVGRVQLVLDSRSVGVLTAAPYTFTLTSLSAGSHILSSIATDTDALSSVSAPVIVTAEQPTSTPAFFAGEVALSNGVYYLAFPSGNYFGYYSFLTDPGYLYHFDLGYEYVFDANDGQSGVYLYDFTSNTFFYTSPGFPFPYLYDFTLNTVLYYYPDPNNPGHYDTNGIRYFYDFNTETIITK